MITDLKSEHEKIQIGHINSDRIDEHIQLLDIVLELIDHADDKKLFLDKLIKFNESLAAINKDVSPTLLASSHGTMITAMCLILTSLLVFPLLWPAIPAPF